MNADHAPGLIILLRGQPSHPVLYKQHMPIPGVTGQNIPLAGIYPGLKRPRLDYTRVYYGLGQFIPRGILWPRPIHTSSGQNIPFMISTTISIVMSYILIIYLIFQQVTEDSVLSGKLSEKAKLTELKS